MQSRYIKLNVDIQLSDSDREYFIYGIQYKQRVGRIDPPEPRPLESLSNTWDQEEATIPFTHRSLN